MNVILEWLKEVFDPPALLFFTGLFAYVLIVDVPGHRSRKLKREAKLYGILGWTGIGIYMLLLAVVLMFHS